MTGPAPAPVHLLVGDARHGVVAHGLRIAAAGGADVVHVAAPTDVPDLAGRRVIAQFTDRLYGPDALTAAETLRSLLRPAARSVVVLHDLPQPSDGRHAERRRTAYAALAAAVDEVVVASEHEAALLRATGCPVRPAIVPLPLEEHRMPHEEQRMPRGGERDKRRPVVATLGFLYPGKGVEEVIDACAGLDVDVLNLGACSDGHEHLARDLSDRAAAQGISFTVTGWLTQDELWTRLAEVDVPVAAHRHVSASGSINTWVEAGRRPVVARSPYGEELAARLPGAVTLVDDTPAALTRAIETAIADPGSTWLGALTLSPSPAECAGVLERLAAR